MEFVCIVILLICFFSYKSITKKFIPGVSQCSTFLLYWLIIVALGCFHFYRLYSISSWVYLLVIIGSISFTVGYIIFTAAIKGNIYKTKYSSEIAITFRIPFYIALVFAIYVILKQIILILPIIATSGMSDARSEMQMDEELIVGGMWDVLIAYFAKPFIKASMIVLMVNSFIGKIDLKHIGLIIILLVLYFFSEGGRSVMLEIFFSFIYLLILYKERISKRSMKAVKIAVVISFSLPLLATMERGSDALKSIYTYYCGSLTYLTSMFNNYAHLFDEYLNGWASFQGIVKPIYGILEQIGFHKPDALIHSNAFIMSAQSTVVDIAPSTPMNYFMTCFGYAYKDGGVVGVMLILFVYGILCSFVDKKELYNKKNVRWVSIKTYFFCSVLFTMSYFPFAKYLNAMTIVYMLVITSGWFSKHTKLNM